ncbi:MAG TPA: hypothetical protein VGR35_20535 [Tepidisphaeraceae bacterium]|nr:hypothetical protein [Tepidisphaeraceae bacterium]
MLHRAQRISRIVLLAFGTLLLLWLPASYLIFMGLHCPLPVLDGVNLTCVSGVAQLTIIERFPQSPTKLRLIHYRVSELRALLPPSKATTMTLTPEAFQFDRVVLPNGKYAATSFALPLWLLALMMLVWPALEWLLRRSRVQRQGFALDHSA